MISFEIIREKEKIIDYQQSWEQLFDSGGYEASTSFDWTQALVKSHLKGEAFFLILFRDSKEILGIVPLTISETKKYGVSLFTAFPISEYYNTHSDLLLKNNSDEIISAFVKAIYTLPVRWDVFRMTRILETNRILDPMDYYLKSNSINRLLKRTEPSFFLLLDRSYNDYLKKRSDKFRNYLKRMQRKVNERGQIEFARYQNEKDLAHGYDQLLYVEKNSWKHSHETAITSVEKQNIFYKNLCESASERGWLHLFILLINNEPTAYNMGLINNKKYYYLKTSYVEKFRDISPSTVLRAKLIEELILDGVEEFDFPAEPYEWEKQWADKLRWHKSLLIYNKTYKAKLLSIYNLLKPNKTGQVIYKDPRAFKAERRQDE